MVKLVYCIRRKPGLSEAEFKTRWLEGHGPLVKRLREILPMRRYVQSHTISGPSAELLRASRGAAEPFDGITEVWLDSIESSMPDGDEALAAVKQLLEDEIEFIDLARSSLFLTEEHEIF